MISLFALIVGAIAALLGRRRRRTIDAATARRIDFPTQTRRMGLTMTEPLRDRLRPRWLRLSNRDD
ncbi:MAG: hypothetical protein IT450_17555 [Phycisphaerales bacterium]|nr:hypothetical protein [Phycisphaerales bacterium]